MASSDGPGEAAPTRRAQRRDDAGATSTVVDDAQPDAGSGSPPLRRAARTRPVPVSAPVAVVAPAPRALTWVDDGLPARADQPAAPAGELVTSWPRRSPLRPGVLIPLGAAAVLVAGYVAAALAWPLHALAPEVAATSVTTASAPASALPWPQQGQAAAGVSGISGTVANSDEAVPMASIAKVVGSLVVLDAMPLTLGEQGPSFSFSRQTANDYLARDESALRVPVGGSLTQYELLEGTLIGSAGNYIDRLADALYPNDRVYARAANEWLSAHGITGVTVTDPSGIGSTNTATAAGLIALAQRAMADPVIAAIVGETSVELPGAGLVENTNALLADTGVVGIKTGMLDGDYNVLVGKDLQVGDTTVRVYASVLGQPDSDTRWAAARALLAALEQELQPTVAVPAGTVVGEVTTAWGETVSIVTDEDADLILWNGGSGTTSVELALDQERDEGAEVGALTVRGPLGSADVAAVLADDLEGPDPWWRLTHPLELLGLVQD